MWSRWVGWRRSSIFVLLLCYYFGSIAALTAVPTPGTPQTSSALDPIYIATSSDWLNLLGKVESFVRSQFRFLSRITPSLESGFPSIFQMFPTTQDIGRSVNASDTALQHVPTEVLTISPYGNWTDQGWSLRFRGSIYKQPNIADKMLHALASLFLLGASIKKLPPANYAHSLNMTRSVFILKQSHTKVSFRVTPDTSPDAPGDDTEAWTEGQDIDVPGVTNMEGNFDSFIEIKNVSGAFPIPGNETRKTQRLKLYAYGTDTGNATAYLIPPEGLTLISDIDDVLRVSKIFSIREGLNNLFGRPFVPWMNMPEIYANWTRSLPDLHFHYLTTTPEQLTRPYMDYIFKTYPTGSFDTRIVNFTDLGATLEIRELLLDKVFQTFPRRKFIIVGDTTNLDIMSSYPQLVTKYPGQVQCILLRNTSASDSSNRVPYNTKWFKGIDQQIYMFFRVPDDLKGLAIEDGRCYNASIPQNVTFGWQGLPFGSDP